MKKLVFAGTAVVALVAAHLLVGPSQLGGPSSFVVTSGNSMEPDLSDGDLVIVRKSAAYEVGDVVAYRNRELGAPVLHRIIDKKGQRFVFQGDNNDFIDTYEPASDELIGKSWVAIPAGGTWLRRLTTPEVAAGIAAILGLTIPGSMAFRRRRRSAGAPSLTTGEPAIVPPTEKFRRLGAPVGIGLALCVLLGVFALRSPASTERTEETPYEHSGRFAYTATAVENEGASGPAVYDDGVADTGEPIYRSLIDEAEFTFGYILDADPADVDGDISLEARISSSDGWNRTLTLADPQPFDGPATSTSGVLDLARLSTMLSKVELRTGFSPGLYELRIVPQVRVRGSVDGAELSDVFEPELLFTLDGAKMQLAQTNVDGDFTSSIEPAESKTLERAVTAPGDLRSLGVSIDVRTARLIALAGTVLFASLAALLALGFLRARRTENEFHKILIRYPDRFVPVKALESLSGLPAVELTEIEGLIRLADAQERLILYVPSPPIDTFVLEQGGVVYYYVTEDSDPESSFMTIEEVDDLTVDRTPPSTPAHREPGTERSRIEIDVR